MRHSRTIASVVVLAMLGLTSCTCRQAENPGQNATKSLQNVGIADFLRDENLRRYTGRMVADFLRDLPAQVEIYYPIDEPPGVLIGFSVSVSKGYIVNIYCFDLKHVEAFSERRAWKFEDFEKERISRITAEKS